MSNATASNGSQVKYHNGMDASARTSEILSLLVISFIPYQKDRMSMSTQNAQVIPTYIAQNHAQAII
jgi:hypothetical protein